MTVTALDTLNHLMIGPQSPGSHDRLAVFIEWAETYAHEPSDFWTGFHQSRSDCDDTWSQRDDLLEMMRLHGEWLDKRPCDFLQEAIDKASYASLPDRATIYRGCDMHRVMGLAWTTGKDIALGFAKGHRGIPVPNPVLASAYVRKHSIFGAYQECHEQEIVVDPSRHLTKIRVQFV